MVSSGRSCFRASRRVEKVAVELVDHRGKRAADADVRGQHDVASDASGISEDKDSGDENREPTTRNWLSQVGMDQR